MHHGMCHGSMIILLIFLNVRQDFLNPCTALQTFVDFIAKVVKKYKKTERAG